MQRLAVVFDSAGTLLRMYRVAKDISRGILMEDIVTSDLVMEKSGRALVVPQLDPDVVISSSPDMLIKSIINESSIEISCASTPVSKEEAIEILRGSRVRIAEIQDAHRAVRARCPDTYSSTGMIIDAEIKEVTYAISTGGIPFPGIDEVLRQLEHLGAEVYVASGDSMRSLAHLADHGIKPERIYPIAGPKRKREIVVGLKESYSKVVMIGDGLNDIYALEAADLGVLTVQQNSRPPSNLLKAADKVVSDILELPDVLRGTAA